MPDRNPASIEVSRQERGIPLDWIWLECAAGCGDIVWVEPADLRSDRAEVLAVCSAKCVLQVTKGMARRRDLDHD